MQTLRFRFGLGERGAGNLVLGGLAVGRELANRRQQLHVAVLQLLEAGLRAKKVYGREREKGARARCLTEAAADDGPRCW